MSDEQVLARCGCGGEAVLKKHTFYRALPLYSVKCDRCGIQIPSKSSEAEAVQTWNEAMSAKDINVPNKFATDTNVGNKIIYCKDCKYSHMTIDGLCKYCDIWFPNEEMYVDGKHFCASAEKRML